MAYISSNIQFLFVLLLIRLLLFLPASNRTARRAKFADKQVYEKKAINTTMFHWID